MASFHELRAREARPCSGPRSRLPTLVSMLNHLCSYQVIDEPRDDKRYMSTVYVQKEALIGGKIAYSNNCRRFVTTSVDSQDIDDPLDNKLYMIFEYLEGGPVLGQSHRCFFYFAVDPEVPLDFRWIGDPLC